MQRDTALQAELDTTAATAAPDTTETDYNPFAPETKGNSLANPPQVKPLTGTGTVVHDKPPPDAQKQPKTPKRATSAQSQSSKTPPKHAQNSHTSDLTQETIQGQGQGKQKTVQATTAKRKRRTNAQIKADNALQPKTPTPNTLALRQDNPDAPMSVAYSKMLNPPDQDVFNMVLSMANTAGLKFNDKGDLSGLFEGVARFSSNALARIAVFLFSVATGSRHKESFLASGLNNVDVTVFARIDDNFAKMYTLAKQIQGDCIAQQVLDAARTRAVDGVQDIVTGRTGKDQDGVLTDAAGNPLYRTKYSDKLAEVILRATDKRFRDDPAVRATGGSTVYHIQVNHLAVNRPATSPIPAEVDGKRAEKTIEAEEMADLQAIDEI